MATKDTPDPMLGYEKSLHCPVCGSFARIDGDGGNGLVRVWCSSEGTFRSIHESKLTRK